jgi:hypothetical protein
MEIAAAFLIVGGLPLLIAVGIDSIRMSRLTRAAAIVSVPVAFYVWLSRPLDITTEPGLPFIALVVVIGWVMGFLLAPLLRALMIGAIRLAKPS